LPRNSCDAYFYSQKEIVAGCIVTSVAHCRTKDDALAYVLAVVTAAMGDLTKNEVARVGEEFVRVVSPTRADERVAVAADTTSTAR